MAILRASIVGGYFDDQIHQLGKAACFFIGGVCGMAAAVGWWKGRWLVAVGLTLVWMAVVIGSLELVQRFGQ